MVRSRSRFQELVATIPDFAMLEPLLVVRRALREQIVILHRRLLAIVRDDEVCRRLGVGTAVALTYRTTVSMLMPMVSHDWKYALPVAGTRSASCCSRCNPARFSRDSAPTLRSASPHRALRWDASHHGAHRDCHYERWNSRFGVKQNRRRVKW